MGYTVIQNQKNGTWELIAPGGIHLETFRTKAEADRGARTREQFNKNMGARK